MDKVGLFCALPLLCISIFFFGYRLYQDRERLGSSMIIKLLLGTLLALIGVISVLVQPRPWWLYSIGALSKQYGMLLAYYSIDQLLNNRPSLPIVRTRLFVYTTIVSILTLTMNYIRRDHISIIIEQIPFDARWQAYCSESLHHFIVGHLCMLVVTLYWQDIRKHTEPIYTIRRFVTMLAFFTCAVMSFAAVVNVAVSFFLQSIYPQASLNAIYNLGRPLFFILLVFGLVVPQRIYTRLSAPLQRRLAKQQQQQLLLLSYLHEAILQIVPDVRLPTVSSHSLRQLIEISDAREIIWSQRAHHCPITSEDEARYLRQLLQSNVVLHTPGKYLPPPLRCRDVVAHNLAVAQLLRQYDG